MLGVMPLYHATGVRALQAMAMVDGRFVCIPKFEPEVTLAAIERERVTSLNLVPTLYHMLLEAPGFRPQRVASIDKIGFAGAPMSAGLIARVEAAFTPSLFVNQYGCSELYALTVDQHANHKPGSSGRAALNQRLRIVTVGATYPDSVVPQGTEGEIVADLADKKGIRIDCEELTMLLNSAVVPFVATVGQGINELKQALADALEQGPVNRPFVMPEVHQAARAIARSLPDTGLNELEYVLERAIIDDGGEAEKRLAKLAREAEECYYCSCLLKGKRM